MVKVLSLSFFGVLGAIASAQTEPVQLGDAQPVDVRVTSLSWQPQGKAFLYEKQEEKGIGLGAFALGKFEGKSLLHLNKGDWYEWHWLGISNTALIVTKTKATDTPTPSWLIQMYTVDADAQTAKLAFKETFENKTMVRTRVDVSPLLKHAIITVGTVSESRHFVVSSVSGEVIKSLDIDRAEKEGMSGPSWSIDGTAVYHNASANGAKYVARGNSITLDGTAISGVAGATQKANAIDSAEIVVTGTKIDDSSNPTVTSKPMVLSIRMMVPTPPNGSPVFEVMPSNGVVRPVRFRGPWEGGVKPKMPLIPRNQSIVLQYEKSNAQDSSVWIKRGTDKAAPATFLGVHISQTFLSPNQNAVAYLIDGALFWRTIK